MMRRVKRVSAAIALLCAAVACVGVLESARSRRPSALDAALAAPALPAGVARTLSLGFASAVADVAYLQAIQVFGTRTAPRGDDRARDDETRRRAHAVFRLLDYVTDLDPAFRYAYVFGAVAVPSPLVSGGAAGAEEAAALLEKGVREVPDDWRLPFHLGFIHAEYRGDFAAAASAMAEAGRRPGRPSFVPPLATRLAAAGGSIETAVALARAMVGQAPDDEQRGEYMERLRLLELERGCLQVEIAAAIFREAHGRLPARAGELVAEGLLDSEPPEPHGGRIELDPATGAARSTAAERLRLDPQARDRMRRAMEEQLRARAARARAEEGR